MQFATTVILAVSATATAVTVRSEGAPLTRGTKCIVTTDGPADNGDYTLGFGDCAKAVNFAFEASSNHLVADVDGLCLAKAADSNDVVLSKCKDSASRKWFANAGKWQNGKGCKCLNSKNGGLIVGSCSSAKAVTLGSANPETGACGGAPAPAPTTPVVPAPAPTDVCLSAGVACPPGYYCQDSKCWTNYQCTVNTQCTYGQVCMSGWCVYPDTSCSQYKQCPYPYTCDLTYGQCVRKSKCPPGSHAEGPWCVPDAKPTCGFGYLGGCQNGLVCVNGQCVPDNVPECSAYRACPPGGDCVNGQCVNSCEGVICTGECQTGDCEAGVCVPATTCPGGTCNAAGTCVPDAPVDPCQDMTCTDAGECYTGECNAGICVAADAGTLCNFNAGTCDGAGTCNTP